MADWAFSVFELNDYVSKKLAKDPVLSGMRVKGEISGLKLYPSGHYYFTLKDEKARLDCVMYSRAASGLNFTPVDGDNVILTGKAGLYQKDGKFRFYTDEIEQQGLGDLFVRFAQLKQKLADEGLFDAAHKKRLPVFPETVGIVTSEAGAAVHDMMRVARQRNSRINIILRPSRVQGAGAAEDIAAAIAELNDDGRADVLFVGRGGGSVEELWAFNEECVARAIYNSRIPVISCVGHETDFTIADFVADMRAATPTHAAELGVPLRDDLEYKTDDLADKAADIIYGILQKNRDRMELISGSYVMRFPQNAITHDLRHELDMIAGKLSDPSGLIVTDRRKAVNSLFNSKAVTGAASLTLQTQRKQLYDISLRFSKLNPGEIVSGRKQKTERLYEVADESIRGILNAGRQSVKLLLEKSKAMDPGAVLDRGYAVVYRGDRIIDRRDQIGYKDKLTIRFKDGSIDVKPEVENKDE